MVKPIGKVQLGKQGITSNFILTLKSHFDKHEIVKVNVLKSAGREKVLGYIDILLDKLGNRYTAKKIGFVIVLKKYRKARR